MIITGRVPWEELPAHYVAGDVFAMPCRTHGRGLDVEGLGIVYLEASASGLPVVAGDSGGAPETVLDGVTGNVVDGRDLRAHREVGRRPARGPDSWRRRWARRAAGGCPGTGAGRTSPRRLTRLLDGSAF